MIKFKVTLGLVLAVFSFFYYSNTSLAKKAGFGFSITGQYSFNLTDLDGSSSVRLEVKPDSGGTYVTINGLDNIASTGSYTRTPGQMQSQFGFGSFLCRVNDNSQFNHFSQDVPFTIAP